MCDFRVHAEIEFCTPRGWRVFNPAIQDIETRNADADPDQPQALLDDGVAEVRGERRVKPRRI